MALDWILAQSGSKPGVPGLIPGEVGYQQLQQSKSVKASLFLLISKLT